MSRRVPNQGRNADVHLPEREQSNTLPVRSAADLTKEQVWCLLELAILHGGHPADRCYSRHGFEPTEADRAIIDRKIDAHRAEWGPWIRLLGGGPVVAVSAHEPPRTAPEPDPNSGTLPPTDTYSLREWSWEPAAGEGDGDGRTGTLVIDLERAKGGHDSDTYAVTELDPLPGLMGRVFKLVNMSETPPIPGFGERTTYETVVGGLCRCSCPAGQHRAKHGTACCKHLETLTAVVGRGLVDGPKALAEATL